MSDEGHIPPVVRARCNTHPLDDDARDILDATGQPVSRLAYKVLRPWIGRRFATADGGIVMLAFVNTPQAMRMSLPSAPMLVVVEGGHRVDGILSGQRPGTHYMTGHDGRFAGVDDTDAVGRPIHDEATRAALHRMDIVGVIIDD